MATLAQIGERVTTELHERVERLVSAVQDDAADLGEIARLAEGVGEMAGTIEEIYTEIEQMLMRGLEPPQSADDGDDGPQQERPEEPQAEQSHRQAERNGSQQAEEVTKEELLERAREVDVAGRSSMSKEELANAIEAEESLTKEGLLSRAREAEIEGRSSMTKEELRAALHDAHA